MSQDRLLDPTLDLNFKRVFAGAPELLCALINAVRWNCPPITVVDIRNAEIVPEDLTQKLIVLDVLARDEAGRILNIEMQSRPYMGLPARLVFYLARLLVHELRAGEDYRQVSPVVGITLLDFDLFPVQEQALWAFELRDGQRPEVVLDRSLSLHMLELPKAERQAQAASRIFQIPPTSGRLDYMVPALERGQHHATDSASRRPQSAPAAACLVG